LNSGNQSSPKFVKTENSTGSKSNFNFRVAASTEKKNPYINRIENYQDYEQLPTSKEVKRTIFTQNSKGQKWPQNAI
jgi:hypothetical protein